MSLRKKATMTPAKIFANRANGKVSKGPATPEGRMRIREANTRHGFYSEAEAVALACLGEDPADLERLRQNLRNDFEAPSALQEEMAEHLAQVVWRWRRAGRMQEGHALRLARDANLTRDDRLHGQMMRLKITAETLRRLAQSVAREDYVTTKADLEMMKNLQQEGAVKEMGEIALALFCQLQPPGMGEDGIDRDQQARNALRRIKEIFGLHTDTPPVPKVALGPGQPQGLPQNAGGTIADVTPASSRPPETRQDAGPTAEEQRQRYPKITEAEWDARERPRQLLENILKRQVDLCEKQRQAILKESMAGPSPYERAAEIMLAHPETALMQRMEESSFRQIWRITTLLLKIKSQARSERVRQTSPRSRNVTENTAA